MIINTYSRLINKFFRLISKNGSSVIMIKNLDTKDYYCFSCPPTKKQLKIAIKTINEGKR